MTVLPFPSAHPLIRKLESIFALTDEERAAIERLPLTFRDVPAGEAIVSDGDKPTHCCLVLAGLVCRCKTVGNGHRQIFMFHIRGDIPDLQSLHIEVMDHEAVALQPSKVAFIPHQDLRTLTRAYPRIADALWRDTLIDAAVFRAWLVNVGARSAYNRIAHLLCELMVRAQAVGLADGNVLEHLPTQEEIGQALGLSHVHVNRTLRDFRVNGLVTTQRRRLTVLSWEGLQQAAEFDPTYLHLRKAV